MLSYRRRVCSTSGGADPVRCGIPEIESKSVLFAVVNKVPKFSIFTRFYLEMLVTVRTQLHGIIRHCV